MSFKFKIGDFVLVRAAIVQQAVQKHTVAKVLMVTGLITVERNDGVENSYEIAGDDYLKAQEAELIGIDGYDPDFTTEQVLEFIADKKAL